MSCTALRWSIISYRKKRKTWYLDVRPWMGPGTWSDQRSRREIRYDQGRVIGCWRARLGRTSAADKKRGTAPETIAVDYNLPQYVPYHVVRPLLLHYFLFRAQSVALYRTRVFAGQRPSLDTPPAVPKISENCLPDVYALQLYEKTRRNSEQPDHKRPRPSCRELTHRWTRGATTGPPAVRS